MSETGVESPLDAGLAAWQRGDLDGVALVLDPAVTLRALNPGPWDCENRDQVMALLHARAEQRRYATVPDVEVLSLDASTYLVSVLGGMEDTATVVKVAGGKVVSMQQISTQAPDPDAEAAVAAVRSGDLETLARVLATSPDLARTPLASHGGRTLLHVVTDWPGYWLNGVEVVGVLIAHGADPNHRGGDGKSRETPLHWAASSDDVDVARALLDAGADPEAPDGSIGTPLDNAVGYGCWHVAELLASRGARVDKLWHAAALGRLELIEALLGSQPDRELISQAFWHACAASQRRAAERLMAAGADLNWTPDYAEGTPLDAALGRPTRQENVVEWLQERGAISTNAPD